MGGLGLSRGDDLLLCPQGWAAEANLLCGGTSGPLSVPERLCWTPGLWDQLQRRPSKRPAWPLGEKGSSFLGQACVARRHGPERKEGNLKAWAARGWCPAGPC